MSDTKEATGRVTVAAELVNPRFPLGVVAPAGPIRGFPDRPVSGSEGKPFYFGDSLEEINLHIHHLGYQFVPVADHS